MNYFSCSPLSASFYIGKTWNRLPRKSWIRWDWHGNVILTLQWCHRSTCDQHAVDVRLFIFYLSHRLVQVCQIEYMGKNNGNPDLVCEKFTFGPSKFSCRISINRRCKCCKENSADPDQMASIESNTLSWFFPAKKKLSCTKKLNFVHWEHITCKYYSKTCLRRPLHCRIYCRNV